MDNEHRMTDTTALGITNFGIRLLHTAVTGVHNGIVAIPSVAAVLAMTMLGAKEDTATQIKGALSHRPRKHHGDQMECEDEVDGMVVPNTQMDEFTSVSQANGTDHVQNAHGHNSSFRKVRKILRKGLSFGEDSSNKWVTEHEDFHSRCGQLLGGEHEMEKTSASRGYTLRIANRLYLKKNGSISKGYIGASEKLYNSKPEVMNFAVNPEKCRHEINAWVEKQTAQKIKDLIPPGSVDVGTSIIIVNAIYFKGEWANKFEPCMTKTRPFTCLDGRNAEASFMLKTGDIFHKFDDERDCQVVELPYVNRDLSFFVVLPNEPLGLTKLEESLDSETLTELTSNLYERDLVLYLPKFKIEVGLDLSEVLQAVGITDMFDPNLANLKGMDPKGALYVSRIMHKAYIEVNEEGSEAAGATAEIVRPAGGPSKRTVFKADHAFVFLIKDNRSGSVLFMGRYCQP